MREIAGDLESAGVEATEGSMGEHGAIAIAEGESAEVKQLAEQIIASQAREIEAMNEHRTEEFGAPSPAGGVPVADGGGEAPDSAAGGHSAEPGGH